MTDPVLRLRDLRVVFPTLAGPAPAVRGVSLDVYQRETVAIVGESGSGKSVTMLALLGLLGSASVTGSAPYRGQELVGLDRGRLRAIRGAKVSMRYANGTLIKLEGKRRQHEDLGAIFLGDKGRIEILRGDFVTDRPELKKGAPPPTPEGAKESLPHIENFFQCIRSRKLPNAHVEAGQRATTLCHLVNICRKVQRKLRWDPQAEQFVGDEEANKLLSRPRRKGYELPVVS